LEREERDPLLRAIASAVFSLSRLAKFDFPYDMRGVSEIRDAFIRLQL
jgi:hypothetical protein